MSIVYLHWGDPNQWRPPKRKGPHEAGPDLCLAAGDRGETTPHRESAQVVRIEDLRERRRRFETSRIYAERAEAKRRHREWVNQFVFGDDDWPGGHAA